jgi:hypothetical protein
MAVVHLKIPAQLYQRYSHLAYLRAVEPANFMCQILADQLGQTPHQSKEQSSRLRHPATPMTRFALPTAVFEHYAEMAYQCGVSPNDLIFNVLNHQLNQQVHASRVECQHRSCAARCQRANTPLTENYTH